uniref:Neur_chan_LBD domain-containing protein n=1 Tax=Heterorhabditis bacteriophora TaxID=37862 RepID=A0A1I7XDL1_HETBA
MRKWPHNLSNLRNPIIMFQCGSWTYQKDIVNLLVEKEEIHLGDFYDNQEWLLMYARLHNGTTRHLDQSNESFSMVSMELSLKRQSFYYVFNLVFPTTLVSLVAVIGFHAPINATGRRESKFRLGIMTLLSMSVMLLMFVGEMKFAMESVPGQRGSFSDVPLLGIYYMTMIFIISIATCTSSIFVHLEKYALKNPSWQAVPWYLRWLAAKKLFCCYVPKAFRYGKENVVRNNNVQAISVHSSPDHTLMKNLIPKEVNFTEINQDAPLHGEVLLESHPGCSQPKVDLLINLIRELISIKENIHRNSQLRSFWERIIRRLETISLSFYLSLIAFNITMFLYPEVWY